MARKGRRGWHGEPRRHGLARMGVSSVLPDGRRLDVSRFVARGGYKVGVKYNVAGFVKELGGWCWGFAFKDDDGVWFFTPDRRSGVTFELKPRYIKVYGECREW